MMRDKMNKKIALQTLKLCMNYGGILQAFALQYFLEKQGMNVVHLNRDHKPISFFLKLKLFLHSWRYRCLYKTRQKAQNIFDTFINKYIHYSPPLHSTQAWIEYIKINFFDAVIVGSDQVWRLEFVRYLFDEFFLKFPKGKEKKIAYAASFGKDQIDKDDLLLLQEALKDFDAISVREQSGANLIRQNFNLDADHLLDPTLLLDKKDYIRTFSLKRNGDKKYVLGYILDKNPFKMQVFSSIKENLGLDGNFIYGAEITKENYRDKDISTKTSVEDWLQKFYNADFVITDSFHGMVFSIIFNKQFVVIANEQRGVSRFESLLKLLSLDDRLIFEGNGFQTAMLMKIIDYSIINKIIQQEQLKTDVFLRELLNE